MNYTLLVYPNRFGACRPIEELTETYPSMKEVEQTIRLILQTHPEYSFYIYEER